MPLPAMIFGVGLSAPVEVLDVSPSGARLKGSRLPDQGNDVEIEVQNLHEFATVMWSRGDQCGVAFASPLAPFDVERLRQAANLASFSKLTVEQQRVLEDWMVGLAR